MRIQGFTRRDVIKGGAAFGAIGALPTRLAGQPGPAGTLPSRGNVVIRGATVLTMDDALGDFASGDVHIRDGAIVAVGAAVNADGAEAIDGRGMICMPGFIDTHWHLWISMLRPFVRSDVSELSVFPVSTRLGQHMTPQDSLTSVRLGVAEALAAGVTTVLSFAHNVRSAEHAEAEIAAMRDTGIRGRFAYGPAQGMPDDQTMDLDGLARIKRGWAAGEGLLTLGMCSRNVGPGSIGGGARGFLSIDMARKDWGGTRALGLPISMHTSGPSPIMALEDAGLLGPDVQLVHALLTTPQEREILHRRGMSYAMSPVPESRRALSLGEVQFGELLDAGVKVSLSTDHTANYKCDPFGAMRILFALHQHRLNNKPPISMKRMVQLATLDGAIDMGLADKTGSLTPGKRADLVLVRTSDPNMALVGDPYETLMSLAEPANVDTVVVDGRILRRNSRFTALDHDSVVREARDAAAALRARAKWPA